MFKKTVIAIFLLSFAIAQDAVDLEENKHNIIAVFLCILHLLKFCELTM